MHIGNTRNLQFSAVAPIERAEVTKDTSAFHNLPGALRAFAEALRSNNRKTSYQNRNIPHGT